MTSARIFSTFVETATSSGASARTLSVFAESAVAPTVKARSLSMFVEVAVGGPLFALTVGSLQLWPPPAGAIT